MRRQNNKHDLRLKIRTSYNNNNSSDITVQSCNDDTIENLNQSVHKILKLNEKQHSRLIFKGKLLCPGNKKLKDFPIDNDDFIHVVVNNNTVSKLGSAATSSSSLNDSTVVTTNNELNRALLLGLSSNASVVRSSFFDSQVENGSRFDSLLNDTEESFQFRMDEEGLLPQDSSSALSLRNAAQLNFLSTSSSGPSNRDFESLRDAEDELPELGTCYDLIFGFSIGVTFGFLMIFCVWDRSIPYRQKLGLLLGVCVSTFVGASKSERLSSHHLHLKNELARL